MENKANYFFFKAPFRTHFSLKEENVLGAGEEYEVFWQNVSQANLGENLSTNKYQIQFLHKKNEKDELQFESVAEDASVLKGLSPKVMKILPLSWFHEKVKELLCENAHLLPEQYKDKLQYIDNSCSITIFKNTVANVDMLFEIKLANHEINEHFIDLFEAWSNCLAGKLIHFLYNDFIFPLIKKIITLKGKTNFISPLYNHYGFPDINESKMNNSLFNRRERPAMPLWVSRMLVIGDIDNGFDELVRRWIITTKSKERIIDDLRDSDLDEKQQIYLGWMHSLCVADIESDVFEDTKQAMSLAQYQYVVLDSINMNLSQIIGISAKKKSVNETQRYKALLEEMVAVANLNTIEFADVTQSLQRNRAYFVNDLMDKWTVTKMAANVNSKIELCKENINKIYQKAFNRSQRVAELLLFFISGFAILEFLKGLSEFFWNPENYEEEAWGLYNLGKALKPNLMLWFGIILFLLMFIFYTKITNKRK